MPEDLDSTDKLFAKHFSEPYNPKLANYDGSLPEYNISAFGIMVFCRACDRYLKLLNDESHPVQNEQDDEQDIIIKKL